MVEFRQTAFWVSVVVIWFSNLIRVGSPRVRAGFPREHLAWGAIKSNPRQGGSPSRAGF